MQVRVGEPQGRAQPDAGDAPAHLVGYPLLDALLGRRSRRFAEGMRLDGGPLAYASARPPRPLRESEEAVLAFAACGVTGHALAELPYRGGAAPESGGGNIMARLVARTVASADAVHTAAVAVLNDAGTWLLKRPQDFPREELAGLVEAAHAHRFEELYRRARVRLADRRLDAPRELPVTPGFNKWSTNAPGTTLFLPVAECSALYINILLTVFEEDYGYYLLDDRHGYRPAGLARFARSRGGHLQDDPRAGRVATVEALETWLYEFAAVEQGGILQNLGLMTQGLGLGGFPFFAAHPSGWPRALGFRMQDLPVSRVSGLGAPARWLLRALGRDLPVPTAVGLERDGAVLLRPYCPPYYGSMREAVLAYVDSKYGAGTGTLRDGAATPWRDGAGVVAGIPRCSDRAVAATVAYCEHVFRRYGRFPARSGPFRTVLAYQAHHLDAEFYARFYRPEALSATQREHLHRWHGAGT